MEIGTILDLATLAVVAAWCWIAWRGRRREGPGGREESGGAAPPPDGGQSDEERRLREGFANLMAYRGPVTDKEDRE